MPERATGGQAYPALSLLWKAMDRKITREDTNDRSVAVQKRWEKYLKNKEEHL